MTQVKDKPADTLADFRVSAPSRAQYKRADGSRAVAVAAIGETATVNRGPHIKSGVPALFVQNGATQTGLPLAAIGAAIAGGLITKSEIESLLSAS